MGQRRALIVVALLASSVAHADRPPDPTAIVIVLDRSSALHGERLEVAKLALIDLVGSLSADDRVAIVAYAKRATVIVPMGVPARDRIAKALDGLATDGSDANLESGLALAATLFTDRHAQKRQVIVMSATDEIRPEAGRGRAQVLAKNAAISTIAIQLDTHTRLDQLEERGASYAVGDLIELPAVLRSCVHVPPPRRDMVLVIVIDRSSSMFERDRMAIAKATASRLVDQLAPTDMVSIIAFGSDADTLLRPTRAANRATIKRQIYDIEAGGSSELVPGLQQAQRELDDANALVKQVYVITDGDVIADGLADQVTDLRLHHVTVSAVGLPGADRQFLSDLASTGNGRLFMLDDSSVVRIVMPPEIQRD